MTVKQGEDINKQFSILKDSLSTTNEEILRLRSMISIKDASLAKSQDQMVIINKQLDTYKSSYELCENDLRMFRKEHKNIVTGILIIVALWTAATVSAF